MSRNRMKDSQSLHWMSVIKWVLIAGLLSGLGLSYMLCKNRNMNLAEETSKLKKQLALIDRRNQELAGELDVMKSPKMLERRLAENQSSLIPWGDPRSNWVRMDELDTRAALVKTGTMPRPVLNYNSSAMSLDSSVMASSGSQTQPSPH